MLYRQHERFFLFAITLAYVIGGYFFMNVFTAGREVYAPLYVDSFLPTISWFVVIYFSSYLLWALPFFIASTEQLRPICLAYWSVLTASYLIFLLYPIQMLRPEIQGQTFFDGIVLWLYSIDHPYNTFPSIHVGLAFLASFFLLKLKQTWYFVLWAIIVAVSTLFIKQHYLLDVVGGFIIALLALYIYNWWK